MQQGVEVDPAVGARRHHHHLGARLLEPLAPFGLVLGQGRHQGAARLAQAGRRLGQAQSGVDHHAQRLAGGDHLAVGQRQLLGAHGEPGVVEDDRLHPGEDGAGAGTQALHLAARLGTGDPLGLAGAHGGTAIEAHGHLQAHEGPAVGHAHHEAGIERQRLVLQQTHRHLEAGLAQQGDAPAGHLGIGVLHGDDDAGHPGLDQRPGAGAGAALMGAGFQGHVGGGAAGGLPRRAQGVDLGVGLARPLVPALADDPLVLDQHAAHPGVGVGGVAAALGQFQGAGHPGLGQGRGAHHRPPAGSSGKPGSWARRSISARNSSMSWKRR